MEGGKKKEHIKLESYVELPGAGSWVCGGCDGMGSEGGFQMGALQVPIR